MRFVRIIVCLCCLLCCTLTLSAQAKEYAITYPSVDQHGDSLLLSGKVSIPVDKPAKGLILIPHYTITANEEAPSINITGEARYFSDEYVLLVPDFIGYGITSDWIHPYLHGELTAQNCVDMLWGTRAMLDSMQLAIPLDSIYIVGFSQGGATALWTLKLLEEQYSDRIHVIHCYAGGGPYDVAVTYDESVATGRVFMPAAIAMLVVGTDAAYDLHLDRSDFFTPAMERAYAKYIEPKTSKVMPVFFHTLNHRLKHWLTPLGRDKTQPQMKRLYEGLRRSSLVTDSVCPTWTPQAPLYVFHSVKDDVVTIRCAEHLQRCYPNLPNITYDFGNYGGHMKASYLFYPRVRKLLDEANK